MTEQGNTEQHDQFKALGGAYYDPAEHGSHMSEVNGLRVQTLVGHNGDIAYHTFPIKEFRPVDSGISASEMRNSVHSTMQAERDARKERKNGREHMPVPAAPQEFMMQPDVEVSVIQSEPAMSV